MTQEQLFIDARLPDIFSSSPSEETIRAAFSLACKVEIPLRFFESPLALCDYCVNMQTSIGFPFREGQLLSKKVEKFGMGAPRAIARAVQELVHLRLMRVFHTLRQALDVSSGMHIYPLLAKHSGLRGLTYATSALACLLYGKSTKQAQAFAEFVLLVGGFYITDTEVLIVKKPIFMQLDEQGFIHNASGPAVRYADGWSVYSWHGVAVPKTFFTHSERALFHLWSTVEDVEYRRILLEIMGAETFLRIAKSVCIDESRYGTLFVVDLGLHDPERIAVYVKVHDTSTERDYYLRVPPHIKTAQAAVAWTFGLPTDRYCPVQES